MASSQSVFALYAQHAFGFDSFTTGSIFAVMGIFAVLNQTVLLRRVWLQHFTQQRLELLMIGVLAASLLLMALRAVPLFILALPFFSTGQSVLRVVLTSEVAGRADAPMKGEALGILASLMSAAMILGPVAAGALFEIRDSFPYILATMLMVISLAVAVSSHGVAATSEHP
jgi:hypothetical protein